MSTAVEEDELEVQTVLQRMGEPGAGRGLVRVDRLGVAREATRRGSSARYIGTTLGVTSRTVVRYRSDLGISQRVYEDREARLKTALEMFRKGQPAEQVALELNINPSTAKKYRAELRRKGKLADRQTPRRETVRRLSAKGWTVPQIARAMKISPRVVTKHRRILRDLGLLDLPVDQEAVYRERLETVRRLTTEGQSLAQTSRTTGLSEHTISKYRRILRDQGRLVFPPGTKGVTKNS